MEKDIVFIKREKVGEEIYSFTFEKPEGVDWKSGQHAVFKLNKEIIDSKGYRVFTIVTSKREEHIIFTTKIHDKPSEFKQELMNLKKGDKIKFDGPYGYFHINKNSNTYVGIAGGIGITPFRSILYDLSHEDKFKDIQFELIYTARNKNFAYKDELDSFAKSDNITIHYANDRSETQKILKGLIKKYREKAHYYVAGTPELTHTFKEFLQEQEISLDNIRCDNFEGY